MLLACLVAFLAETIRAEGPGPLSGWTFLRGLGVSLAGLALALVAGTAIAGPQILRGRMRAAAAAAQLLVTLAALLVSICPGSELRIVGAHMFVLR